MNSMVPPLRTEKWLSMKQDPVETIKNIIMSKGKVKWYNEDKGFGFIATDNGNDIFVHRTGLVRSFEGLKENDEVEFETKQGERGLIAINVESVK